jgi:hypothetical protein
VSNADYIRVQKSDYGLRNALEGLRKTSRNRGQVDRFSCGTEVSQIQTEVPTTTLRYFSLNSHWQLQILCTQKEKCYGSHERVSQKDIGQPGSSLFSFVKSMPALRCDREGGMQRTSVSVYRFALGTTK